MQGPVVLDDDRLNLQRENKTIKLKTKKQIVKSKTKKQILTIGTADQNSWQCTLTSCYGYN